MNTPSVDQPKHFAAIDLGSNSFHLMVVRNIKGDLQTLFRYKERVRLASGLNKDSILSQDAIDRGIAVLKVFADQLAPLEQCDVMVVATHTLREARNRREFLLAAAEVFPFTINIISGQEEARLIYMGVANDEQLQGNTLVIDIGGGSSEIVIGRDKDIQIAHSHQMGCVSFTERFFSNGITKKSYQQAKLLARQRLERFEELFRRHGWQHVRITSGTAQAIWGAMSAMNPSAQSLTLAHIVSVRKLLIANDNDPIFEGLTPERVGVLAAGLAIMEAIFEALVIDDAIFSTSALREGLLYESFQNDPNISVRNKSCTSLQKRYHVDNEHAERVTSTARSLWEALKSAWQLAPNSYEFLAFAAQLHEVGLNINTSGMHKHSAYIVENSNLPGFSFEQQQLVAGMIRLHRKKFRLDRIPDIQLFSKTTQLQLIQILRLAIIWHLNRHPVAPTLPPIEGLKYGLKISLPTGFTVNYPLLFADLQQEVTLCSEAHRELNILPAD